jgi:hypothetical protein
MQKASGHVDLQWHISRLSRNLQRTISNIEYATHVGELFLAVDTCEIYEYVLPPTSQGSTRTLPTGPALGVRKGTPEYLQALSRNQLALTWLFNQLNKPALVLPPHAEELWGLQQAILRRRIKLREAITPVWETLTNEERNYLDRLAPFLRKGKVTSLRDRQRLLAILRQHYASIFSEGNDFLHKVSFLNAPVKLDKLLRDDRLRFYGPGRECDNFRNIRIELDDSLKARIHSFMSIITAGKPSAAILNKLRDSQALVIVEELNRRLTAENKRILFVSRDRSMQLVADAFPESIGYYICDVESLFLLALSELHKDKSQSWLYDLLSSTITMSTALEDFGKNPAINAKERFRRLFSAAEHAWSDILNQQLALSIDDKNWPSGTDNIISGASDEFPTPGDNLELCAAFVQFVLANTKFRE